MRLRSFSVVALVTAFAIDPIYIDYGMNVIYEDETVYVDNQPMPFDQYAAPIIELAVNTEQAPPPLPPPAEPPPTEAAPHAQPAAAPAPVEEWLPLGVFALAQEERATPPCFSRSPSIAPA